MKWMGNLIVATWVALAACTQASIEVTATGTHVTISPAGVVKVKDKATQSFTVTADAGYTVVSAVVSSCPPGSWEGSVYTTGPIVASCAVGFSAATQTLSVSPSGTNVTLSSFATQTVARGATQAFTVTADTGDTTSSTVGGTCPAGTWSGAVYTTGAITSDCTVTFSATPGTYLVTASGDAFVTIAPTTQTVGYSATPAFTVIANPGYTVSSIVDGTCPPGAWMGATYTTGAITSDCTASFSAALTTWQVTASGDAYETVAPSTPQTVSDGATQSFTITTNDHYAVSSIGGTCPPGTWSGTVYTTGLITADCAVSFSASLITWQVTASGDSCETIAPATPQIVTDGAPQAFTVTLNDHCVLSPGVGGTCPAGTWNGSVYTTGAITTDCTASFSAALTTSQVTASGDTGVMFSPSTSQVVPYGMTATYTVTAITGYVPSAGGSCPAGSWNGSAYTTGPITSDCAIAFSSLHALQMTVSSDTLLTVSPTGTILVGDSATQPFTVTPMSNEAASFAVGGTCPEGTWAGFVYTTGVITSACTISFTGTTPALQPSTWTTSSEYAATTTVTNVTGATDTVQFTYAGTTNLETTTDTFTAQTTALTTQQVQLAWSYTGFHAYFSATAGLTAFVDGPFGKTVTLQPSTSVSGDFSFSGTTSLLLQAGQTFGVVASGINEDSNHTLDGTVTLNTVGEVPGDLVTASSSDMLETITPATQLLVPGQQASFTVISNAGYAPSQTVGGTCPTGSWTDAITYTTGPLTSDCTVLFSAQTGYAVSASGPGLTLNPSPLVAVLPGRTVTYTVEANSGVSSRGQAAGTCPAGSWHGSSYTTGAVTENCTVVFSTNAIYMYVANGNFNANVTFGNLATTTQTCQTTYETLQNSTLACNHYAPLLGYSSLNGVQNLPNAPYSLPTDAPFLGANGYSVASNWSNLLALPEPWITLDYAGFADFVATGFTNNGALTLNCSDWQSSSGTYTGPYDGGGWGLGEGLCNDQDSFACLCWDE